MTAVHPTSLQEYWDADASTYVRTHALTSPGVRAAWRAALRRSLPPPPARVLDVGAGTGAVSLLLAELGYEVTALDYAPKMLEHLGAAAAERGLTVNVVHGAAGEPPDGPFDAVTAKSLLWMVPDRAEMLRAWRRVAPHGRVAVFEAIWGATEPGQARRERARRAWARVRREEPDHHRTDDPAIHRLFSRGALPDEICAAVEAAGWGAPALERLRDVEWANSSGLGPVERFLRSSPYYAVSAG